MYMIFILQIPYVCVYVDKAVTQCRTLAPKIASSSLYEVEAVTAGDGRLQRLPGRPSPSIGRLSSSGAI